jgi:hypothetical protein
MTAEHGPFRDGEFPSLEHTRPPDDPSAPIDYPPAYAPWPPPVYRDAAASYPPAYPVGPSGYPAPYPEYWPDPYDPYRSNRPVGTNGMAIAALVSSLAGLLFCGVPSIVGLALGIIAMRETRKTGQEGYGIALAGAVIGGIVAALWVFLVLFYLLVMFVVAARTVSPTT